MTKKRYFTEGMAKVAIYLLFTLAVFGCVFFVYSTMNAHAASAEPAQPPARAEIVADLEVPLASGAPELDPTGERDLDARAEANAALAAQARAELGLDAAVLPEPDEDALASEVERLAASGFLLGQDVEAIYLDKFYTTAYCCENYPHICGGNGVTASGTVPTQGLTVAADWSVLPAGTWLYIEDVGVRRVEDTGSAIKNRKLDIAIDTHANALAWGGLGNHEVWVLSSPLLLSA